jgi:hypothetical protein
LVFCNCSSINLKTTFFFFSSTQVILFHTLHAVALSLNQPSWNGGTGLIQYSWSTGGDGACLQIDINWVCDGQTTSATNAPVSNQQATSNNGPLTPYRGRTVNCVVAARCTSPYVCPYPCCCIITMSLNNLISQSFLSAAGWPIREFPGNCWRRPIVSLSKFVNRPAD